MEFETARDFASARPTLPGGPVAIVLCDSPRQAANTVSRLAGQGVGALIVVGESGPLDSGVVPVVQIAENPGRHAYRLVNTLLGALAGRWVVWLWAGEFLFYPFSETRSLPELTDFLRDERRKVLFSYALDLYAIDMPGPHQPPWDIALHFDAIGYQPFPQPDQGLNLYGGLSWRFEELVTDQMHQLGRSALVQVGGNLALDRNWRFDDPEYDSVSCPWHHSPTGAVMSLRRTWRIMAHPGFTDVAGDLIWQGSTPFEWTSQQLLELGIIEPGQWF